jgi:hypothetical protein
MKLYSNTNGKCLHLCERTRVFIHTVCFSPSTISIRLGFTVEMTERTKAPRFIARRKRRSRGATCKCFLPPRPWANDSVCAWPNSLAAESAPKLEGRFPGTPPENYPILEKLADTCILCNGSGRRADGSYVSAAGDVCADGVAHHAALIHCRQAYANRLRPAQTSRTAVAGSGILSSRQTSFIV